MSSDGTVPEHKERQQGPKNKVRALHIPLANSSTARCLAAPQAGQDQHVNTGQRLALLAVAVYAVACRRAGLAASCCRPRPDALSFRPSALMVENLTL